MVPMAVALAVGIQCYCRQLDEDVLVEPYLRVPVPGGDPTAVVARW